MEWDYRKAAWNLKVHGLSFAEAEHFDFETALELEVQDHEEEEERIVALGRIRRTLCALVYTIRGDKIRVISLRKATAQERRAYAAHRP
jgi:uncharacterized protein